MLRDERQFLHQGLEHCRNSSQSKLYLIQTVKKKWSSPGKVRKDEHLRRRKDLEPEQDSVRVQGKATEWGLSCGGSGS